MATQILIDGTDYTTVVGGLESLTISLQKDDSTKTVNTVLSSRLTFYSEAFDYLQNKFFDVPESKNLESEITIITDCCGDEYNLLLRGDALTICFADCTIEGQLVERSQDLEAFNTIRNTVGLTGVQFVSTTVCKNVGFVAVILWTFLELVRLSLLILASLIAAVANVVDDLEDLQEEVLGCGLFDYKAVNVGDVMAQCANSSGLTFESSIFNGAPYNNLYYVDTNILFDSLSCQGFIELFLPVFNADYQIRNGVMYFERKDFFLGSVVDLVNVDEAYANGLSSTKPCYTYTDKTEYAYGRFEYSADNQDSESNIILDLTNDIVEWNEGNLYPARTGEFTRIIPFSPARFTEDRDSNNFLNQRRPFSAMIMSEVVSQYPKLVIGDAVPRLGFTNAFDLRPNRVLRNDGSGRYDYSTEMWFEAAQATPELYNQFQFIEDPNVTPVQPYQLEDFTFVATCDQIQLVRDNGVDVFVTTRLGKGRPQSIDINYDNKTITVKGVKIEVN